MRIISWYLVLLLTLITQSNWAQEADQEKIEILREQKQQIIEQEKEALKVEIKKINQKLKENDITSEEAANLKKDAAEKRARNIENRIAIIDNQIALIMRNGIDALESDETYFYDDNQDFFVVSKEGERKKTIVQDRRTYSDLVIAFGLNNAIREGESFSDSPFKFLGSRFFEVGYAWNTRVFRNSNWLRLKYGFSFQFNVLKPTNNRFFAEVFNDQGIPVVELIQSQIDPEIDPDGVRSLSKSKLRSDNFVFPIHFEFGPSAKAERGNYVRYSTRKKFKFGIGGYVGFNFNNTQKVKFDRNSTVVTFLSTQGDDIQKAIYGLSSYAGYGDLSLYLKYDLNPTFESPSRKQNNISLGLRFDL